MNDDNKNMILAIVLALGILFVYQSLVIAPMEKRQQAARVAAAANAAAPVNGITPATAPTIKPIETVRSETARIAFESDEIDGTISLAGARIDDLRLKNYREELDEKSPEVTLLKPQGTAGSYYAFWGWVDSVASPDLPGAATVWTVKSGTKLTPSTPVTLEYVSPQGLVFTRVIALDAQNMFTVSDTVENKSAAPVDLSNYGVVRRHGVPVFHNQGIVHHGAIGVFSDWKPGKAVGTTPAPDVRGKPILTEKKYKPLQDGKVFTKKAVSGWLGFTDLYWLTALAPASNDRFDVTFNRTAFQGQDIFETNYMGELRTLAPGANLQVSTRFFAGAKKVSVLERYGKTLDIPRLERAVDWGNFWFFTKPLFSLLAFFESLVKNWGVAILLLTVAVKAVFFPLVNKSYESMAKLKQLMPEQEKIKARFKDDPQKMQLAIFEMYKKEKVSPFSGCLPMLVPIPVFYALYKVLVVTIEMRHAPFFGWIQDLTAKDPTTIFNLFGLLPFDPTQLPVLGAFLAVGIWPVLYGLTMWALQSMSPKATDPIQAQMMSFMPLLFTFMFGGFAAGLVIYWTWSNCLSILQQYIIMRRMKIATPFDEWLAKVRAPKSAAG